MSKQKPPVPSVSEESFKFCTGTSYTGEWNALGMTGQGIYIYQHGCQYEGAFYDGRFHGKGTLTYPRGQKLTGWWQDGCLVSYSFVNADGLAQQDEEEWTYCQFPDRRFCREFREGLQPAGREIVSNQDRALPPSLYDTGDGFYDPRTEMIIMATEAEIAKRKEEEVVEISVCDEETEELESEDAEKSEESLAEDESANFWLNCMKTVPDDRKVWIQGNCRKGWDEPAGFCPQYYPDWITGKKGDIQNLEKKYETKPSLFKSPSSSGEDVLKSMEYFGTGRKLTKVEMS